MKTELKNILIVRTDRIGDVVLSLPLAVILKKHYKNCKVSFLLRDYTKALAENHPALDNITVVKEKNKKFLIRENIKLIKSFNFDVCIVVYPTFRTALIIFLSGIKIRIGTGFRWYSFLFNKRVFEHRKYAEKHELEYNVNLLKEIGIKEKVSPGNISFQLSVDENDIKSVRSLLKKKKFNFNNKLAIIHPGSGGSSVDLPVSKMKMLTKMISELENTTVILTGNKNEIEFCSQFVVNDSVLSLAGEFNLKELKALISISDIFISNSTGPIHIAATLGKYTIGFYPKIASCSQKRWGPYTVNRTVFTPTLNCSNCTMEQCQKLDCMNSIDIGRVFEKTKTVLGIN